MSRFTSEIYDFILIQFQYIRQILFLFTHLLLYADMKMVI